MSELKCNLQGSFARIRTALYGCRVDRTLFVIIPGVHDRITGYIAENELSRCFDERVESKVFNVYIEGLGEVEGESELAT